jgi:hypothetical protein
MRRSPEDKRIGFLPLKAIVVQVGECPEVSRALVEDLAQAAR